MILTLCLLTLAVVMAKNQFHPKYRESIKLGGKCVWEDFKVGKTLGKGGHGTVKKARHVPSNTTVALKIFRLGKESWDDLSREESVQHSLDHPKISKHLCTMVRGDEVVFVLEFVRGHSLRAILKDQRLFESEMIPVKSLVRDLVDVLDYLRHHHIVFGDLSSGNVMISDGQLKLVDFGAALQITDNSKQDPTPVFVNYKTRPHRWHNYAADWYSLGLLTLEVLVATSERKGEVHWRDQRIFYRQSCGSLLGVRWREACDLVDRLVTKDWKAIWGQDDVSLGKLRRLPWLASAE